MNKFLSFLLFAGLLASCRGPQSKDSALTADSETPPNIVVIYLDDLGFGDVSSYGGQVLKTPNIDALANNGIRFTSGYATSATCTPSRFGMLTGQYPWKRNAQVLSGDAPLIIDPKQQTLPKSLRQLGYHTGVVGKWHLGLGDGNINWNEEIKLDPRAVGFDYEFIMAATNDRVPTVYIEEGKVVNLDPNDPIEVNYKKNFEGQPTGKNNPELLKFQPSPRQGHNSSITNGISRIGFMKGGNAALWVDEQMSEEFYVRACDYVDAHKDEPFFLYYAMHAPHVPRVPSPRFRDKSGLGARGDVIMESDWYIGQFIEKLEKEGLLENTLIVISSDNGPVLDDGYMDGAAELLGDHKPGGPLKGGKYSLYEAGTRVPFITYWKGKINSKVSEELVSQLDLAASLTALAGGEWSATEESENVLPALLGTGASKRKYLIQEGGKHALRTADGWSFIPPYKGKNWGDHIGIPSGFQKEYQLYNLNDDLSQQENLAEQYPEKVEELEKVFDEIVGSYRRK